MYRTIFLLITVLAIPLLVTRAQDDDDTLDLLDDRGVGVLPLEAVTESAVEILDITPTSARLNFIGTEALACTVVYGITTAFGSASIDTTMSGGAIIEHNPVMINLEPDTEYFYRVQGSGEDGTFYIGEVGSFRTAPAPTGDNPNLASAERGAQIIAWSSAFGDANLDENWGAGMAFDGNPSTAWSSAGDGSEAWIEVELESRARIDRVEFWSRAMNDGSAITHSFTIETDEGESFGPFELDDTEQAYSFDVEIEAQTLRFNLMDTTGGNTGAVDIAVYGEFIEAP
jgi:hypothetical protein